MIDKLLPCPFCGGEAERLELTDEENFGGSVISCKSCGASSPVHFGRKENLDDSWNSRKAALSQSHPAPSGQAVAGKHKWAPIMDGTLCCQYCMIDQAASTSDECSKAPRTVTHPAPVGQLVEALLITAAEMAERSANLNEVYQPREDYLRFAQQCRSAIAGEAADGGWRLVPIEPTEAMVLAARIAFDDGVGDPNDYRRRMRKALKAAALASPASPAGRE